jgi:hypothetical protein
MAGVEVTGTELYDQMSGETTDMTMRQRPDLYEETNFGGTQPAEGQPTIPSGELPTFPTGEELPEIPSAERLAPRQAPDLDIIDLGDFKYTTATNAEKILVGSISTWLKAQLRAYKYNPSTKTKININDFVLDVDGLKLRVIDRYGNLRMVRLSNKNGGYLALRSVIESNVASTKKKISEIFPEFDFTKITLSKEALRELKLSTLTKKSQIYHQTRLPKTSHRLQLRHPPQ